MLHSFIQIVADFGNSLGYLGVFLLMTIESSFIPFPSEIVILPAAAVAASGEMNIYVIVLLGICGSLLGALINYFLADFLGRPLVYTLVESRWAKYFLLNRKKVERSEALFLKYGGVSTFIGRLVPVVRQLISIPAGFARMKLIPFLIYTGLGAGIWITFLAVSGYLFGSQFD